MARFLAKADGVIAGLAVADMVCRQVDPSLKLTWSLGDGDRVQQGMEFGLLTGSARSILVAERICLNFMQRMSGIATATAAMVAAAGSHKAKCVCVCVCVVCACALCVRVRACQGGMEAGEAGEAGEAPISSISRARDSCV